jgi:hypothetical protein
VIDTGRSEAQRFLRNQDRWRAIHVCSSRFTQKDRSLEIARNFSLRKPRS